MKKLLFIVPAVLFTTLILIGSIYYYNYSSKEADYRKNRDYIFCQQLHKGMTIEEITQVLNTYGEYEEFRDVNLGFLRLGVRMQDDAIVNRIGKIMIMLNIDNSVGYTGPEIPYGGESEAVCINGLSEMPIK